MTLVVALAAAACAEQQAAPEPSPAPRPAPAPVAAASAADASAADPSAARSIGVATMEADGTIVLQLRATEDGVHGEGYFRYAPGHKDYSMILGHVGGLRPGESKPVPPFP
jgi:hypothetical protein